MIKFDPFLEILLAAAIGAGSATFIDATLAADGSMVLGLSSMFSLLTGAVNGQLAPIWLAGTGLVALAALSVLYFRPLSRKGGFACGFAAVAILALFIP